MERAQVTSVEALESFRASLILYLSQARPAVEEVVDDVHRTRIWLQSDRISHWEHEVRRRRAALEQARQELLSARLSALRQPSTAQLWAVTRAQHALEEAEQKLSLVRKWNRDFENLTNPLTKQLSQLQTFLTADLRHAIAYLAQVVDTLKVYTEAAPPPVSGNPGRPGETKEANDGRTAGAPLPSLPPASSEPGIAKGRLP